MPRYFISLHPNRFVSIFSVCVAALTIIFSAANSALADSSPPAGGNYYQGIVISYQISECYDAPSYCQNLMGVNWQTAQMLVPEDIAAVDSHIGLGTDEPPWIYYGTWTCQSESPWAWEGIVGPVGNPPRDAWFYMPSGYYFRCTSNGVNAPSPRWLVGSVDIGCRPGDKLSHLHPGWCEGPSKDEVSIFSSPAFIPSSTYAGKQTNYRVLTQSDLILKLTRGGQPVSGMSVPLQSSRGLLADDISPMNPGTDSNGHAGATVSTWDQPGDSTISSASSTIETAEPANISWLPAQYQSPFLLTCYVFSLEKKFIDTKLVKAPGIKNKKYHEGFLKDVKMQGTGLALDGEYIHYQGYGQYTILTKNPTTRTGTPVIDGVTVAVDPHIIPLRSHITISGKGDRLAQDIGGGINGYHIDLFYGFRRHDCVYGLGKSYGHTVTLESYGN